MKHRFTIVAGATILALGIASAPLAALAEDTDHTNTRALRPTLMRDARSAHDDADAVRAEKRRLRPALTRPTLTAHRASTSPERAKLLQKREQELGRLRERADARFARAQERAGMEIDRRIDALEAFAKRVGNASFAGTDQDALRATMQTQIDNLMTLRDRLLADGVATTTLREGVQSIAKSYRVFSLVVPKGAIVAAADRVNHIVSQTKAFSSKLTSRIGEMETGGTDVTALRSKLGELDAKVASAAEKAQAAVDQVNALEPDNGNEATLQANKKALQDAHQKIRDARQDLKDARALAGEIVRELRAHSASSSNEG